MIAPGLLGETAYEAPTHAGLLDERCLRTTAPGEHTRPSDGGGGAVTPAAVPPVRRAFGARTRACALLLAGGYLALPLVWAAYRLAEVLA